MTVKKPETKRSAGFDRRQGGNLRELLGVFSSKERSQDLSVKTRTKTRRRWG